MLAFIFSFVYRRACKKYLTDMRHHRWNTVAAG
jgi:hypothetical protein